MSLNETVHGAVTKKVLLMDHDSARYAGRGILAGVYLTIGTAFAAIAGNVLDKLHPGIGLGAWVFGVLFGLGLFMVVLMNSELATGNMMFGSWGATTGQITWGKAFKLMIISTFWNLIGALLIAAILGMSAKFNDFDTEHLVATLTTGKLEKPWYNWFFEGIAANFIVNIAIVGALFAKDYVSKFFIILPVIGIFVSLGLEHVIANFSLMTIAGFSGLFNGVYPEGWDLGMVLFNWGVVWVGNVIGGGILIGSVYAWLNRSKDEVYRD